METELMQNLQDVGYKGALLDIQKLEQSLEKGAKSLEFTGLVAWLAEQLVLFENIEEHVHATTSPEDSSSFLLELSSFLKELGCTNDRLTSGNVNQRLSTRHDRILLLEYLIVELMASRISHAKTPQSNSKLQVTIHESSTAKCLKDMLIALQIGKPPDNISCQELFSKLQEKLRNIITGAPQDLLGKPLILGELSPAQWEMLDQIHNDMMAEYKIRREMLLERLDVTVQSFLWSDRVKSKANELNTIYRAKRDAKSAQPNVTIAQLLAARDDVAIIEKTSNARVRRNAKSSVTKIIIGKVPDRGGRADEQAPPPPEMPSWQKNRVPDAPRGQGGGRRGHRGGYQGHNNDSRNFRRDTEGYSCPQSFVSSNLDNILSNEDPLDRRGGGGYNRGRGRRVQGGWAQGRGYRGRNRAQHY